MITIEHYKRSWPSEFTEIGKDLRAALGGTALAIHHIGSTSVPGLDAKDVIDVQVTVANLNAALREPLEQLGFTYRDDLQHDHCPLGMNLPNEELAKRTFAKPERRVNLHVRVMGRWNQGYALLCRDYLRATPMAANAYGEIKRQLARYFPDDTEAYYIIKDPVFDVIMAGAFHWKKLVDWQIPRSDA
jgi:GrpB-like predicted nucleotidyltransferase (UPF0157 family)